MDDMPIRIHARTLAGIYHQLQVYKSLYHTLYRNVFIQRRSTALGLVARYMYCENKVLIQEEGISLLNGKKLITTEYSSS